MIPDPTPDDDPGPTAAFTHSPSPPQADARLGMDLISDAAEKPGDFVGRYRLAQQIGEGGFGTVWMAEQTEPFKRQVALKVIKLGMDTREIIARFEQERQALAMMDHPNIAKVLDAGATDRGRPYFVMELVNGIPITQFCDESKLGMRDRLALFADVCSAINHAHQKGVIHRDIKPSNVMVALHDEKPVVKVIDFGIAKATEGRLTDKTLFTCCDQIIGTPVYMSPEQAGLNGLDIDTRSDIYALGVLLYELLTGKPPFDAKTLASAGHEEMLRIIREVEPPKPSSRLSTLTVEERTSLAEARRIPPAKLGRLVEPDLDWIVMKAIEKDRDRRYETVLGLALDVLRFLSDEPVSASPPNAGYMFRKFARRNKAAIRTAVAVAALLMVATAVSTWQAVRATQAERKTIGETQRATLAEKLAREDASRATLAEKLAKDEATRATLAEKKSAETLKEVARERDEKEQARQDADAVSTFLTEILKSPDPARKGRTVTVAEILDQAVKELDAKLASQPGRRAKLQATLGETYRGLGLLSEAARLHDKVLDYYRATYGNEHPATLSAMVNLSNSQFDAGRRDEALKLRQEVLALRSKLLGPEHLDTLIAMNNLANSYYDARRWNEALKLREEVLTQRRRLLGQEHPDTLMAMHNLAISYSTALRWGEALELREEVLTLRRKILGPEHPDTLSAMNNLAVSYYDANRREEALKMREEVLTLYRKVLGLEHPGTLLAMSNLATSYYAANRRDEALKLREEVLPLRRKVLGPEHPNTLGAMDSLAFSCYNANRRDEALKLREEVLALRLKLLGQEHPDTLSAMGYLASSYYTAGRRIEAIKLREDALTFRLKLPGSEGNETTATANSASNSYYDATHRDEMFKLRQDVLTLRRKILGPEHPASLMAQNNLALCCISAGRRDEAIKLLEDVRTLRQKVLGPGHPDTIETMKSLASAYRTRGDQAKAESLEKAITAARTKPAASPGSKK